MLVRGDSGSKEHRLGPRLQGKDGVSVKGLENVGNDRARNKSFLTEKILGLRRCPVCQELESDVMVELEEIIEELFQPDRQFQRFLGRTKNRLNLRGTRDPYVIPVDELALEEPKRPNRLAKRQMDGEAPEQHLVEEIGAMGNLGDSRFSQDRADQPDEIDRIGTRRRLCGGRTAGHLTPWSALWENRSPWFRGPIRRLPGRSGRTGAKCPSGENSRIERCRRAGFYRPPSGEAR